MATISLPQGRRIEVLATVNAGLEQRVEVKGPGVELRWEGAGEGNRIGQSVIEFPGGGSTNVEVTLSFFSKEGMWTRSHETVREEYGRGEVHVSGEDGRGVIDSNDVIVRFRWVA